MDIQSFISCKRSGTDLSDEPDICSGKEVSGGTDSATSYAATNELPQKKQHQSEGEKRKSTSLNFLTKKSGKACIPG